MTPHGKTPSRVRQIAGILLVPVCLGAAIPSLALALRAAGLEENAALQDVADSLGVPSQILRAHRAVGLEEQGIGRRLTTTLALGLAAFFGVEMASLLAAAQTPLATPPPAAVAPAQPKLQIEKLSPGTRLTIQGSPGAPGRAYRIEAAEAVMGPWTEEGFVRTDAAGVGRLGIAEKRGIGQRFFRAVLAGPDTPEIMRPGFFVDAVITTTFDTQGYAVASVITHPPSTRYDENTGLFTTTERESRDIILDGYNGQRVSETTTITQRDAAGEVVDKTVAITRFEYFEDDRVMHTVGTTDTYGELDGQRTLRDHRVVDEFFFRPDAFGSTMEKTVSTRYNMDTLQPLTRLAETVVGLPGGAAEQRVTQESLARDPMTDHLETSLTVEWAGTYRVIDPQNRFSTVSVETRWISTTFGLDGQPTSCTEFGPQVLETTEADGAVTRSTITTPTFERSTTGEFVPVAWTTQSEVTAGGVTTAVGDVTGAYDPTAQVTTITLPNGVVITKSDRDGTLQVGGPGRAPLVWRSGQGEQRTTWPDGLSATITAQGTISVQDPASPFTTVLGLDGVIRYRPAGGLEELRDGRPEVSTQA